MLKHKARSDMLTFVITPSAMCKQTKHIKVHRTISSFKLHKFIVKTQRKKLNRFYVILNNPKPQGPQPKNIKKGTTQLSATIKRKSLHKLHNRTDKEN